ncbi:phosphoribosyltransferase [Edaphovirga cremea]|uniref:phosphoribosyltransferase n=1 Tax=Edaphovirga cremea TaxID=2267246 RepID=UPI003989572F
MGFEIDVLTKTVTVNHSHNNYANTAINGNPDIKHFDGLKVTSIFKRTKGRRDKNTPGDNNPMLYALKNMQGLKTTFRSICLLWGSYDQLVRLLLQRTVYDCIIPLPSSSPIAGLIAKNINKRQPKSSRYFNALKKISAERVLFTISDLRIISSEKATLRQDVKRFIAHHGRKADFQMKSIIRPKLRKHINPIVWGEINISPPPINILLIDDMVTSGASLLSARDALLIHYPGIYIECLTLFGSSR